MDRLPLRRGLLAGPAGPSSAYAANASSLRPSAEFKEKAEAVQQEVRSRIDLEWNQIKFSHVLDASPEEWYRGLPPDGAVKAVVDALGGVSGLGSSWNYYEFRDMYEKLIRKKKPGAVAQLTSGRKKEMINP